MGRRRPFSRIWVPPLLLERSAGIPRKETSRSFRQAGKIGRWVAFRGSQTKSPPTSFLAVQRYPPEANSHHPNLWTFGRRARQFRVTFVFKRSRAPFVARDLVSSATAAVPYNNPWRTAAARPGRTEIGSGWNFRFCGRSAESAETRGPSEARPQRLKCS